MLTRTLVSYLLVEEFWSTARKGSCSRAARLGVLCIMEQSEAWDTNSEAGHISSAAYEVSEQHLPNSHARLITFNGNQYKSLCISTTLVWLVSVKTLTYVFSVSLVSTLSVSHPPYLWSLHIPLVYCNAGSKASQHVHAARALPKPATADKRGNSLIRLWWRRSLRSTREKSRTMPSRSGARDKMGKCGRGYEQHRI